MSEGLRELLAAQLLKDEDPEISNLRDVTDLLLFDPKDPIDYTAAGVAASGIGAIPAGMTIAGNRLRKLGKLLKTATVPTDASRKLSEDKARKLGNFYKAQFAGETAEELVPGVDGMAKGGLADIPVQKHLLGALIRGGIAGAKNIFKGKSAVKKPKTDAPSYATDKFGAFMPGYMKGTYKTIKDLVGPLPSALTRGTIGIGIPAYTTAALYDYFTDDDEIKLKAKDALDKSAAAEPEPETFIEKLQAMDPALARALIAGGAKMLQPTEGPVRSFLGLGEFGEGFSESLAKSEAAKSDTTQLYEAYVRKAEQEGKEVLGPLEFASAIDLDRDDRSALKSELLDILKKRYNKDDLSLSDVLVEMRDSEGNLLLDAEGSPIYETADALLAKASQADLISVRNLILDRAAV